MPELVNVNIGDTRLSVLVSLTMGIDELSFLIDTITSHGMPDKYLDRIDQLLFDLCRAQDAADNLSRQSLQVKQYSKRGDERTFWYHGFAVFRINGTPLGSGESGIDRKCKVRFFNTEQDAVNFINWFASIDEAHEKEVKNGELMLDAPEAWLNRNKVD